MKKKKQGDLNYERLNKTMLKENRPNEDLENMMINDIKRVLDSYFVFHNDDLKCLFAENCGCSELTISLKYRQFKDIKIL